MQEVSLTEDQPWPKHMFSVINEPVNISTNPRILIIIPSKDRNDLLFDCVNSIVTHTTPLLSNIHIRIVDTGSTEENKAEIDEFILQKYAELKDERFYIGCDYQGYYNFAKNNNQAFKTFGNGMDYVVFCNNDIKFLNDVLGHMVSVFETKEKVGTVGARLHFGNGAIQHIGAFSPMVNSLAQPGHYGFMKATTGAILDGPQLVPANTCALLMMPAKLFTECRMFSEEYNECFEDVQLNLTAGILGYKNYCHLSAVAFHYESQTRNVNPEKQKRQNEDLTKLSRFIHANKANPFIKEVCYA